MTEGPYKLPEGWRWVKLGEVASAIKSGFAFRKKNTHGGNVLHLRPYNIGDDGQLLLGQQFLIPRTALPANWSSLKPGDVLFNNTNSVELIGKTALVRDEMEAAFSNHITLIRVNPVLCEGSWLMLSLNALWRKGFFAQQCNKWIGQAGYNIEMLRNTTIPLPPLEEQQRIVAKVEALMARVREAKRLRRQAKEDAERLWQAALAETFPRPGAELPAGWRWVRLGEVAKAINGCGFPKRYQGRQTGPIAFLKVSDLNSPENDPEVTRAANYVDENTLELLRGRACKPGTIVFPKIGGAIATNKKRKLGITAAFDNNVMGLLPNEEAVSSDYLLLWTYTIDLTSLSKVGPVPSIRQSTVENQRIPLPQLPEQCRIVAHLEAVWDRVQALKQAQEEAAAHLNDLERSILDKAFRGEL